MRLHRILSLSVVAICLATPTYADELWDGFASAEAIVAGECGQSVTSSALFSLGDGYLGTDFTVTRGVRGTYLPKKCTSRTEYPGSSRKRLGRKRDKVGDLAILAVRRVTEADVGGRSYGRSLIVGACDIIHIQDAESYRKYDQIIHSRPQ